MNKEKQIQAGDEQVLVQNPETVNAAEKKGEAPAVVEDSQNELISTLSAGGGCKSDDDSMSPECSPHEQWVTLNEACIRELQDRSGVMWGMNLAMESLNFAYNEYGASGSYVSTSLLSVAQACLCLDDKITAELCLIASVVMISKSCDCDEESPMLDMPLLELADFYFSEERYEEAFAHYDRYMNLSEHRHTDDHVTTAAAMANYEMCMELLSCEK